MDTAPKAGKGPKYLTAVPSDDEEEPQDEEYWETIDLSVFFAENKVPYKRQLQICSGHATYLRSLMNVNKGKSKKKRVAAEEANE